ncbi:pilus assembly protein [Grimontia kaedaensis]|uniref:Pilus assembly protein n=1 Tax=Grimontia kaedaensis TaxID=2872157 RepID=A0ABY4X1F0_9GAMM|nr:TadE family protein [Grimontia kaedaensis]USH05073.1 pilus assembly protein [Grimontia kaedaensis]
MQSKNNMNKQRGVVAIEFVLGFMAMFSVLIFWVEICVVGFMSSAVDYAIAESSRNARTSANSDYKDVFIQTLNDNDNAWVQFLDRNKFNISVRYYESYNEATNPNSEGSEERADNPIALYRVSYDYSSIFNWEGGTQNFTLAREVFGIQEFERDQFSQ